MPKRHFGCLWSKDAAVKKHKRWTDGAATFEGGLFSLSDLEGTKVGSFHLNSSEAAKNLSADTEFRSGGLSIQLLSETDGPPTGETADAAADFNFNMAVTPAPAAGLLKRKLGGGSGPLLLSKRPLAARPPNGSAGTSTVTPTVTLGGSMGGVRKPFVLPRSTLGAQQQRRAPAVAAQQLPPAAAEQKPFGAAARQQQQQHAQQQQRAQQQQGMGGGSAEQQPECSDDEYEAAYAAEQEAAAPVLSSSRSGGGSYAGAQQLHAQQQPQQQRSAEPPPPPPVAATGDVVLGRGPGGQELKLGLAMSRQLKLHQREGVLFLWRCLVDSSGGGASRRGAILADEMGLGKTLTTLSLISALLRHCPAVGKVVVTCPSSLVNNWAAEVAKWCGPLLMGRTVVVSKGGRAAAEQADDFRIGSNQRYALLIISYDLYRTHANNINAARGLGLLVCDEGHRLKSRDSTKTMKALEACPAPLRLMITGTPVQNNLEEFFSLAHFVFPGVLGDPREFRFTYARPIENARDAGADSETVELARERREELAQVMGRFVLRRTKSTAATGLPPKTELTVFCAPAQRQRRLYTACLAASGFAKLLSSTSNSSGVLSSGEDEAEEGLLSSSGGGGGVLSCTECGEEEEAHEEGAGAGRRGDGVLPLINRLRQVCNHPDLLADPPCDSYTETAGGSDEARFRPGDCGKLEVLERLLVSVRALEPEERVVLCSNYTSALDVFEALAKEHAWPYVRLDGSTVGDSRQALVDKFNFNPSALAAAAMAERGDQLPYLFLLSAKAGGCGLNLVGGNRLVLYDQDWNPATCAQTMARVWRFGQTRPVTIYRFVTAGTLEETIFQRQLLKGELAAVVDGADADAGRKGRGGGKGGGKGGGAQQFSLEELRDLFTLREGADCCDTRDKLVRSGGAPPSWHRPYRSPSDISDPPLAAAVAAAPAAVTFIHATCTTDAPAAAHSGGAGAGGEEGGSCEDDPFGTKGWSEDPFGANGQSEEEEAEVVVKRRGGGGGRAQCLDL